MSTLEQRAYEVAVAAAVHASQLVLRYWPNPLNSQLDPQRVLTIFDKDTGVGNYATIADKESEAAITAVIRQEELFANHGIDGEESGAAPSMCEWRWILDPIDGTPPFNHGLPEYGISIGLIHEQEPVVGVIALPAYGQIIAAQRGARALLLSLDGKELVDLKSIMARQSPRPITKALIGYDLGYENRGQQLQTIVAKLADRIGYPVSYASSSTANFRLAQGLLGAYFCQTPTIFDIGAAATIIPEIGGVVTDMTGKPIDWNASSRSYLASYSPALHHQVLTLLHE
jgi:fructose-1,6-bisphosphatase/inositol monophosphatase family enzyme